MKQRLVVLGAIASAAIVLPILYLVLGGSYLDDSNQFGVLNTELSDCIISNYEGSSSFNYQHYAQVIDDTYLGKTVSDWRNQSPEFMIKIHEEHREKFERSHFFEDLGALVLKNALVCEIAKKNIILENPDFKLRSGMTLLSLPPHVSFQAFVNATDGNTYLLSGMTQRDKVNTPVGITLIEFADADKKISIESILSQNNTIIMKKSDNSPSEYPYHLILAAEKENEIIFRNENTVPVRIQGDGDWKNPNWYGPTILPFTEASMNIEKAGVYEWRVRTLPLPGTTSSDSMGGGYIHIIPENIDELTNIEKLETAQAIISQSDIPISMIGHNEASLMIGFNPSIYDNMPEANQYYEKRINNLLPFNVPFFIEGPNQENGRDVIEKMLKEDGLKFASNKFVVIADAAFSGDPGCGALLDFDHKKHYFDVDSVTKPTNVTMINHDGAFCKINHSSCHCNVQNRLAERIIEELTYFTAAEEAKYAQELQRHIKYNAGLTKHIDQFKIGKYHVEYEHPSSVAFCGKRGGTSLLSYFTGVIVDGIASDFKPTQKLPKLCAIAEDAKWWNTK